MKLCRGTRLGGLVLYVRPEKWHKGRHMLLPLQITLSQHLLIMDLFQKKSAGRGGGARLVPILGLKYGRKLLRTQAACAHPNQGSNQIPYHMTKETIAPKTERKILWSGWVNKALGLEQSSDGSPSRSLGSVPAAHSLEAGKVTGTEQLSSPR
ncbi:hypothetical protein VU01_10735 [Candidatus Electrothrix marina]|uniref:Uncharacterized protein n=1 Tax=Candidatus Electrothrix marina TaxID=1859130 RepID=A0A444JFH1_9BACT|nr:hypothetical protein VU01_10735 [Candidatus Electrothrix marina]